MVIDLRQSMISLSLEDKLEVLANLLVQEGLQALDAPAGMSPLHVLDYVQGDIRDSGHSLENATALLGIELLVSLNKLK
jgi:hypothetical protein